ncbi:hypothetical protein CLOM_g973, partial [Closterium sp. NIES-68]
LGGVGGNEGAEEEEGGEGEQGGEAEAAEQEEVEEEEEEEDDSTMSRSQNVYAILGDAQSWRSSAKCSPSIC